MFTIKIAELYIRIHHHYPYVLTYCENYIIDTNNYDIEIIVTEEEIEKEKQTSKYNTTLGYCEYICIYRKICEKITEYDAFLLHAAVVAVEGKGYAFSALSGTGKSTHVSLWLQYFGNEARVINGDKPIIRKLDNQFYAYGTPWCGKEGWNCNEGVPLQGVSFLERSESNHIVLVDYNEIVIPLFQQVLRIKDSTYMLAQLDTIDEMIKAVPFYRFGCTISEEAVKVAYEGMRRKDED